MVTVYTTASCSYCPMVKRYLSAKNIEFTEVDVTDDQEARDKLFEATGLTMVPVVTNGDEYVVGFKPALLGNLISQNI